MTAAVLLLRQKVCLTLANRHADDTPHIIYKTDGISVAYEVQGHGSPIVLLHSMHLGASLRMATANRKLGKRISCIQHRHGGIWTIRQTPKTLDSISICHIFASIFDRCGKQSCGCGCSKWGADIALVLSMLYPTDIKKMILISPEGIGQGFATPQDTEPLKKSSLPVAGTQIFLDSTTKKCIKRMAKQLFWQTERMPVDFVENLYHNARYEKVQKGKFRILSYTVFCRRYKTCIFRKSPAPAPFLLIWRKK